MIWAAHNAGETPPHFYPGERIRVEYRDGSQAEGHSPWEFQGWNHMSATWPGDIVRYGFVKISPLRKEEK
jgi:hypothetical protein